MPARLVEELDAVADCLVNNKLMNTPETESHAQWAEMIKANYADINSDNVMDILHDEVGKVFVGVLEHAGVYKRTEEGKAAFDRFVATIK